MYWRCLQQSQATGTEEFILPVICKISELCLDKTDFKVSDQVRHKPSCTARDGYRLEISDLGSRGICTFVFAYAKRPFFL